MDLVHHCHKLVDLGPQPTPQLAQCFHPPSPNKVPMVDIQVICNKDKAFMGTKMPASMRASELLPAIKPRDKATKVANMEATKDLAEITMATASNVEDGVATTDIKCYVAYVLCGRRSIGGGFLQAPCNS